MPLPPPRCRGREICREGTCQGLVLSLPLSRGRACLSSPFQVLLTSQGPLPERASKGPQKASAVDPADLSLASFPPQPTSLRLEAEPHWAAPSVAKEPAPCRVDGQSCGEGVSGWQEGGRGAMQGLSSAPLQQAPGGTRAPSSGQRNPASPNRRERDRIPNGRGGGTPGTSWGQTVVPDPVLQGAHLSLSPHRGVRPFTDPGPH